MEQVLTVTILSYFQTIHNRTINTSNALLLLDTIKDFKQIHISNQNEFRSFRGLNFESILEVIDQEIHRIEHSHTLYKESNNLLTDNTKQGYIEQKNNQHKNLIDENAIADRFLSRIMQKEKKPLISKKDIAKDMVNSTIIKDALKVKKSK